MLKYIGILCIFIASVMPIFELRRRNFLTAAEYAYFTELLSGIVSRLRYMRPIGDFVRSFDTSSVLHILPSGGGELLTDCRAVSERLSLPEGVREALVGYFSSLGVGTADGELSRASSLLELVGKSEKEWRSSSCTALRVRSAICLSLGLTLVILLI